MQKADLKKYIIERTGYREKQKIASFTDSYNENFKKMICDSKNAEENFLRDVDVETRRAEAFTANSQSFLCALNTERVRDRCHTSEIKRIYKNKIACERGITLLALILTVVIMIILAAVTINVTLGDGGLIDQAQHAAEVTVNSAQSEQEQLDSLEQELANVLAEDSEIMPPDPEEPSIPETETQVANYADVDGNGTVDGIIYADLAIGGSGTWGGYNYSYTIPTSSDFKKYEVTQESYSGSFGTGQVIAPLQGSNGNERFYVLALEDVDSNWYNWYYNAYGNMDDYSSQTSTAFGEGEKNTINMISKWNGNGYGTQNGGSGFDDVWGLETVNSMTWNEANGWYIPSQSEWVAFAEQLNITNSNRSNKGLMNYYWSSSQYDSSSAWHINFDANNLFNKDVNSTDHVRLGTTF